MVTEIDLVRTGAGAGVGGSIVRFFRFIFEIRRTMCCNLSDVSIEPVGI